MARPVGQYVLSALLTGAGLASAAFLAVFYWQPMLWFILLPFPLASLYLGVRLFPAAAASHRALRYWLLSVAWLLTWTIAFVEDATVAGVLVAVLAAAAVAWLARRYIRADSATR